MIYCWNTELPSRIGFEFQVYLLKSKYNLNINSEKIQSNELFIPEFYLAPKKQMKRKNSILHHDFMTYSETTYKNPGSRFNKNWYTYYVWFNPISVQCFYSHIEKFPCTFEPHYNLLYYIFTFHKSTHVAIVPTAKTKHILSFSLPVCLSAYVPFYSFHFSYKFNWITRCRQEKLQNVLLYINHGIYQ